MTKEILNKANELRDDIENIEKWIEEHEKQRHWITIETPKHTGYYISDRMEEELCDWLKAKKVEYEKQLEEL